MPSTVASSNSGSTRMSSVRRAAKKQQEETASYLPSTDSYDHHPAAYTNYQSTTMPYEAAPGNQHRHGHSYSTSSSTSSGGSGNKWISNVKTWLTVSEPSAQAMKKQRRDTYKKHGVDLKDPHAAEKMHFPVGKLPQGAVTSTSGPTPEDVIAKERRQRPAFMKHAQSSHSVSSGYSSGPSLKETNPVAPWED